VDGDWRTVLDCQRTYPAAHCAMYALSCGATSDVFGIHGDKVVYDDGAHGEATESVGEGVQSVVGHHGWRRNRLMEWSKLVIATLGSCSRD
jgi:hypothetical protein